LEHYGYKKYIDEVFSMWYGTIWISDGRSRGNPDAQYGTGGLINGIKKFMLSVT
jgi:modulator of drug activity B